MAVKEHYVIIGNGPAGNNAADFLRKYDKEAEITIISNEHLSYYYRHLLCDYIQSKKDESMLIVRSQKSYRDKNIKLKLETHVNKIDPLKRLIYLSNDEQLGYTKLILASGGKPNVPESLSDFNKDLSFLSTYNDAKQFKKQFTGDTHIIILGGDFTSLRFIRMLARSGNRVTLLLNSESFWPINLDTEKAERICSSLRKSGLVAIHSEDVEELNKKDNIYVVKTDTGRVLKADLIYSFMGSRPNIGYLKDSGIKTNKGVVVNQYLQTNMSDIFACGDCAQVYSPDLSDYWVSIGWGNAELQGKVAAINLLGDRMGINPSPESILNLEGLQIKTSWWKNL